MGWERLNRDRLGKILALAGSDRDGEALAALRKASGMLNTVGLDFGDLARSLDGDSPFRSPPVAEAPPRRQPAEPPPGHAEAGARGEIRVLLQQIAELHGRLARAEADSAFQRSEAQHWHDLTIEAARYVCMLEDELFAIRRALETAEAVAASGDLMTLAEAGDPAERERSAAATGGALGERIAQFAAWQATLSKT
ncbi:MAG: hypothetical protein RIB84_05905 [Sneathiellaceae bacterium]